MRKEIAERQRISEEATEKWTMVEAEESADAEKAVEPVVVTVTTPEDEEQSGEDKQEASPAKEASENEGSEEGSDSDDDFGVERVMGVRIHKTKLQYLVKVCRSRLSGSPCGINQRTV